MKPAIHPEYHKVKAVCVCGNTIVTGSTVPAISVEICEACHPFYTGQQKIVDTEGRVEKFKKRYEGRPALGEKPKKKVKIVKEEPKQEQPKAKKEKKAKKEAPKAEAPKAEDAPAPQEIPQEAPQEAPQAAEAAPAEATKDENQ